MFLYFFQFVVNSNFGHKLLSVVIFILLWWIHWIRPWFFPLQKRFLHNLVYSCVIALLVLDYLFVCFLLSLLLKIVKFINSHVDGILAQHSLTILKRMFSFSAQAQVILHL